MRPIKGNPPPEWATALIERVCAGEGRREPRQVQWWHSKDAYSSGRYWDGEKRLHITAGTMELDQEMVLLHELGHHLARPTWHHNKRYWELTFKLYDRYGSYGLMAWAVVREGEMHAKANTEAEAYRYP